MAAFTTSDSSSLSNSGSTTFTHRESPPSLVHSDFSEDLECIMATNRPTEDVTSVMTQVLGYLDRVVEHLRENEEFEAANKIARDALSIFSTFNDATAPWDIEKCLLSSSAPSVAIKNTLSASPTKVSSRPVTARESWASVAATEIDEENSLVKFRPRDGIKKQVEAEGGSAPKAEDLRVVWIQGWTEKRSLGDVTQRLSYGPLFSMAFAEEHGAVCIIFMMAVSAKMFVEDNEHCLRTEGVSLFGKTCAVVPGHPHAEDDGIRRMASPMNERRRLTFARQQLFANGMTENIFKHDIYDVVGESNVELVWLFNTGNATVVFTATPIARLVRDEFLKKARSSGPYKDLQVSFSHDPCERAMNLITQIPNQCENRPRSESNRPSASAGSYGAAAMKPSAASRRSSTGARPSKVDADGWQMVGRKR